MTTSNNDEQRDDSHLTAEVPATPTNDEPYVMRVSRLELRSIEGRVQVGKGYFDWPSTMRAPNGIRGNQMGIRLFFVTVSFSRFRAGLLCMIVFTVYVCSAFCLPHIDVKRSACHCNWSLQYCSREYLVAPFDCSSFPNVLRDFVYSHTEKNQLGVECSIESSPPQSKQRCLCSLLVVTYTVPPPPSLLLQRIVM